MVTESSLLCSEEHTESICTSIYNDSVGALRAEISHLISPRPRTVLALLGSAPRGALSQVLSEHTTA